MKINKQKVIEALANYAVVTIAEKLEDLPATLLKKLRHSLLFTMTINQNDEIYDALTEWLYLNYEDKFTDVTMSTYIDYGDDEDEVKVSKFKKVPRSKSIQERLSSMFSNKPKIANDSISPDVIEKPKQTTQISLNSGSVLIKHKGARIHIVKTQRETRTKDIIDMYQLSGTNREAIKDLITNIYADYTVVNDKAKLYLSTMYGEWRFNKRLSGKSIDNVILPDKVEDSLVKDINIFCTEKEWYNSLNIPYKRGYLLYGPPGNGKTSLSIAIANHYGRNIYCMDLNAFMTDEHLRYAFDQLENNSVLLIEDVDRAFTSNRENAESKGITFSCLLNCLDGVYQKEGLVTIMTTNFISQLDSALIRPGRIDMKIFIDNPSIKEINKYLQRFYVGNVDECVTYGGGYSMAEIQELCIRNKCTPDLALEELKSPCVHVNILQDEESLATHAEADKAKRSHDFNDDVELLASIDFS